MSNKMDRRSKGVIYPGQSGTGRSQNTFFTETGKEPICVLEKIHAMTYNLSGKSLYGA